MSRHRTRVTLENGSSISFKGVRLQQNTSSQLTWRHSSGLRIDGLLYLRDTHGQLTITYEGRSQIIDMVSQPRRLGGVQWYMLCPTTGRRVSILWKPNGSPIFASRHAWPRQVAYASQFEDAAGLSWKAKRRVARRLGSKDPNDYGIPEKPKWMRWRTYDAYVARWIAADDRLNHMLAGAMGRFMERHAL